MKRPRTSLWLAVLLALAIVVLPIVFLVVTGGGIWDRDVIRFRRVARSQEEVEVLRPGSSVDTNIRMYGVPIFWGGERSRPPYDIILDLTDSTLTLREVEVTSVVVRYADGTMVTAGSAGRTLPRTFSLYSYESRNSSSRGIIESTVMVLQAELKGWITKNQDLTLEVKGRFLDESGGSIPFEFQDSFEWEREVETKRMLDLWKDV